LELRAAAVDLRRGDTAFSEEETARRVRVQLDTLAKAGVRHAVLSAFGCGAFLNPASRVAAVYKRALHERAADFDVVAFAIFNAGYGPDNFTPFASAFEAWPDCDEPRPAHADHAGSPPSRQGHGGGGGAAPVGWSGVEAMPPPPRPKKAASRRQPVDMDWE
jgi:hypothetical protein